MSITERMAVDETVQQEGRDAALAEFLQKVDNNGIMSVFDEWYQMAARIRGLHEMANGYHKECEELKVKLRNAAAYIDADKATNKYISVRMAECALDLARVGNETHKDKNEVILAVIANLLTMARHRTSDTPSDDIPF